MLNDVGRHPVGHPRALSHAGVRPVALSAGRRQAFVLAAVTLAYLLVGFFFSRNQEFWSPDSAVRFVQAESLRRAGYRDVAALYPAASLDPEGRFFPAGSWFHIERGGRHYLAYPPYFPAISAVLYGLLGFPGLIVVPMASGLIAAWITSSFLRRHVPDMATWGTFAVALGTPLVIYSGVFWDHSPTAVLAAGALAIAARALSKEDAPSPLMLVAAGVLLGLGTWLRNEMYLLTAAVVAIWPIMAQRSRIAGGLSLAAGAGTVIGVQWIINARLYGSPLGYKSQGLVSGRISDVASAASNNRFSAWIIDKLGNVYYQFISPDFYAFNPRAVAIGLAIGGALLLAGVLLYVGVRRRISPVVTAGGAIAALTAIIATSGRASISGLLPAVPLVILIMMPGQRARWEWFLSATSAVFCLAVVATGTHGGLQWGPRYLLPVVPALVWLAAAAVNRVRLNAPGLWPTARGVATGLLAVSVLVQAAGVEFVEFSIGRNARVNEALRQAPANVVVTSLEWLALGAGSIYFQKQLMLVDTVPDFRALVERLSDRRVTRWTYLPRSGGAFGQRIVEQWTRERPWKFRMVGDALINGIRVITYGGFAGPAQ